MANSNTYIFKLGASGSEQELFGQMDGTHTDGSILIENTNKSTGGTRTYIDGSFYHNFTFTTTLTYATEATQIAIKQAIEDGTDIEGIIESGTGETWEGNWKVTGRTDTAGMNTDSTMAISINSNGEILRTSDTAS